MNGITLVEYLEKSDKVKDQQGWSISVNPLKIKGADGSPTKFFSSNNLLFKFFVVNSKNLYMII